MQNKVNLIETAKIKLLSSEIIFPCHILAAVSGGPDSTTMLHILAAIKKTLNFKLSAFYLDHGLRRKGKTDKEISFLSALTGSLEVGFHFIRIPYGSIKEQASLEKRSVEDIARTIRYQSLENIRREIGADYIALGHVREDNEETLVMRFFQGSGIRGLRGMPLMRGRYLRPLIDFSKNQILDFLKSRGLEYKTDASNKREIYLRNRIRMRLMPLLIKIFPGYERALSEFRFKTGLFTDYLIKETEKNLVWETDKDAYKINWNEFTDSHPALRYFSLYDLYNRLKKK
ncbi:MAG: tRNA lysidine(34) synthetase TilS, partial [Spirochaetales bacterium]|nr:tRNA lysidine(34) synthetase TilS [Spirochaetales bacterium]